MRTVKPTWYLPEGWDGRCNREPLEEKTKCSAKQYPPRAWPSAYESAILFQPGSGPVASLCLRLSYVSTGGLGGGVLRHIAEQHPGRKYRRGHPAAWVTTAQTSQMWPLGLPQALRWLGAAQDVRPAQGASPVPGMLSAAPASQPQVSRPGQAEAEAEAKWGSVTSPCGPGLLFVSPR